MEFPARIAAALPLQKLQQLTGVVIRDLPRGEAAHRPLLKQGVGVGTDPTD
ncbi:hypothetical protein D3C83_248940 [compost metagenome]